LPIVPSGGGPISRDRLAARLNRETLVLAIPHVSGIRRPYQPILEVTADDSQRPIDVGV